jgi:hypothetical protein
MSFKFELNQHVCIAASGEVGQAVGRAEYVNAANNYYVRYMARDGRAVEQWWPEDALEDGTAMAFPDQES